MTYNARTYLARAYFDSSSGAATTAGGPSNQTITVDVITSGTVYAPTVTSVYTVTLSAIASASTVYAPNVFPPLRITVGYIPSATGVIHGPRILQTGGTPSDVYVPRIRAFAVDRETMNGTELEDSFGRQWQDMRNDTGTGSVGLHRSDSMVGTFTYGHLIRFHLDDDAVFTIVVEGIESQMISPNEEADEIIVYSGRGILSVWEDMVVQPALGVDRATFSDTRLFNFAAPDFDDSGWSPAIVTLDTHQETDGTFIVPPRERDYPAGWPDPELTARWIWDRYAGFNNVPEGSVYFRKVFNVAAATAAKVCAACDDQFELWLDGEQLMEDKKYPGYVGQMLEQEVKLDAGDHYIAVRGINNNNLQAGLLCSVVAFDTDGYATTALTNTDATWKALGYPAVPPGFTPGEIIRVLLEEAQDRMPPITTWTTNRIVLQFNDDTDSSGNPWPITTDVAVQVGTDLLSVLRQLCETYIDIKAMPGSFALRAYSSWDWSSGATFDREVNLTELRHSGEF